MTNERPNAVFSTQDFELIEIAVSEYLHNFEGILSEDYSRRMANLLHRLKRINGNMPREWV